MFLAILTWFNGNKTQIGAFILALSAAPFIADPTLQNILVWVGTMLGGTGIVHKLFKKGK